MVNRRRRKAVSYDLDQEKVFCELFDSEPPIDSTASYTSLKPIQTTKNEVARIATNRDTRSRMKKAEKKGISCQIKQLPMEKIKRQKKKCGCGETDENAMAGISP